MSLEDVAEGLEKRDFLKLVATGAATGLTGCMDGENPEDGTTGKGNSQPENGNNGDENTGNTDGGSSSSASLDDYKGWISADATDFQYIDITGVQEHFQILDSTNEDYVTDVDDTTHWNPYSLAAVGTNDVRDIEETVSIALDGTYDAARVMVVPDAEIHNAFPETGDTHQGYTLHQTDEGRAIAQDGDIIVAADNMQHLEKMLDTRHGNQPAVMSQTHNNQYFRQLVQALETHGGQGQIINGGPHSTPLGDIQAYGENINWSEGKMIAAGVFETAGQLSENKREITSGFPSQENEYSTEENVGIIQSEDITGLTRMSNGFLTGPNYE